MTFRLPGTLSSRNDEPALGLLRRYYGPAFGALGFYTGAAFDAWDSTGTRAVDADRFTADDLVAVTFLSVDVDAYGAYQLLHARTAELTALLREVGPDRDLADETGPVTEDWPAFRLYAALRSVRGLGRTTVSKLLARKRPRLLPIYDSVVGEITGTQRELWEPLRIALRDENCRLHQRLTGLVRTADLPDAVSALRVFDVIAWMEGKDRRGQA